MESVWITGGGTGIGRELALAYARRGAQVWISGRRTEVLSQVVAEAESLQGQVSAVVLDVTDAQACAEAWRQVSDAAGKVNRIILNAGDHREMPAAEFNQQTVEHLMNVNFYGVLQYSNRKFLMLIPIPHMWGNMLLRKGFCSCRNHLLGFRIIKIHGVLYFCNHSICLEDQI